MRISKGYWVWGMFSLQDTLYLNSIKNKVQSLLKSPKFDIHLTLVGPYLYFDNNLLNNLSDISKKNKSLVLNLENFDFTEEIFKSFFIKTNMPNELYNLRNSFYKSTNLNIEKKYEPHISLAYGVHEKYKKDFLISKMAKLKREILLSKISLVEVNEELNIWKILNTYNLRIK